MKTRKGWGPILINSKLRRPINFPVPRKHLGKGKRGQTTISSQDKEVPVETSIYSSFDISPEYMDKFKDVMYDFEYVDRSPFLRIVVDYIYQRHCEPITEIMDKLESDLKEKGYKVKNITPALMGDIFIQVENPQGTGKK